MLLATVAMTLGDNQKAKYWLEQGLSERNDYMLYLELAAEYNPLKKEPWFGEIVKKVKTAGQ